MKKILFILSSAALVFIACQKEENVANNEGGMALTATVEQQVEGADTKSTLDGTTVEWSVGDVIRVYNADGTASTDLTATKKGTSSSFSGSDLSSGTPAAAIYPASIAGGYDGTDVTFTLPAEQTYAANSFGPGANVAVGTVSSSSISFKNVCGVFKLTIYGNYTVSKIELSGKNNEKLNGEYTVAASAYTCNYATTTTDEEKTLTLDCSSNDETSVGAKDGGVTLSPTTAKTFYFVVPVGAFANGFVAKVYEKGNTTTYTELSTTSANSIVRSRVKAMPESTILPPAYQKVEYLQSSGTQYINAGALPSVAKFEYICIFKTSIKTHGAFGYNYSDSGTQRREGLSLNGSGKITFGYGDGVDSYWQPYDAELDAKYIFCADFVNKTISITKEGTKIGSTTFSNDSRTNAIDFYVMATNNNQTPPITSSSQCFGFKVWDNKDALIRNFIPCYDKSKGKSTGGCMYDAVNGVLYQNAGSGNFNCGDEIYH